MNYTSTARIISKRSPKDFVPDGNLRKKVWKTADWVHFSHDMSGRKNYPQSETDVATVWTPRYVYFAYHCKYAKLNLFKNGDPAVQTNGLWNRDVVEVFLNPQPKRFDHYYEFVVSPNNLWVDIQVSQYRVPRGNPRWDSHFEHATHIDKRHHIWTCEFRIPVASMGVKNVSAGAEWRLNLFRAAGPSNRIQRRLLSWSTIPTGVTFHVPARFGIIRFVK